MSESKRRARYTLEYELKAVRLVKRIPLHTSPLPLNYSPLKVSTQGDADAIGRRVQGDRSGRPSPEPARCAAG